MERLSLCFYPLFPVCPLPSEPHAKAHCNRNENYSSADLQTETTLDYLATPHARFHWSRWGVWGENRTDGKKMEKWGPSRQCLWLWSRNLRRNPSTLDQVQAAADLQNSSNEFTYGSHTVILIYCSAKANARSECVAVSHCEFRGSPQKGSTRTNKEDCILLTQGCSLLSYFRHKTLLPRTHIFIKTEYLE